MLLFAGKPFLPCKNSCNVPVPQVRFAPSRGYLQLLHGANDRAAKVVEELERVRLQFDTVVDQAIGALTVYMGVV